jgi:uncharacterized protein YcbX
MEFDEDGPKYDRIYMLIDEKRNFINQVSCPQLVLMKTDLRDHSLRIWAEGFSSLEISHGWPLVDEVQAFIYGKPVVVFNLLVNAGSDFFSDYLKRKCRLVRHSHHRPRERIGSTTHERFRLRFPDGYPVTIASEASLEKLNGLLPADSQVPMENFRPTVVVDGCDAHEEDSWVSAKSDSIICWFEKECERCTNIIVDRTTGTRPRRNIGEKAEPLKTLGMYRPLGEGGMPTFASKYSVELIGQDPYRLKVGDLLEVQPR